MHYKGRGPFAAPFSFPEAAIMSDDPIAVLKVLKAALARRDRAASTGAIRTLLALEAPLGAQWKSLAAVAKQNGEVSDALAAMELYAGPAPRSPSLIYELAAIRAQVGRLAEAAELIEQIPGDVPTAEANAYIRGTIASNLGHFDSAREHLRRAVAINPLSGQAWLALAMIDRLADDDARAMEDAAPRMSTAAPADRAAFLYALGKLRDQQSRHDEAFAAIEEGAAIMRSLRPYNLRRDEASAASAIDGWKLKGEERNQAPTTRAIFVTGLPRSGTTLVEQILAAHSAVDGGEELGLFRLLEQDIGGKSAGDLDAYCARGGGLDELRALYSHLLAERYPGAGRVVDKTLNLSRYAGLVATLFPDAPIIWLRRNPLDCAWSAFRSWFLRGIDWSWSLEDIAAHFKIEDRLFAHWSGLLGNRVLVVDYAKLVSDSNRQIDRILSHCGLPRETACFSPHKSARAVTTASVAQVREPINLRGIDSALPYCEHLKPFSAAYFD